MVCMMCDKGVVVRIWDDVCEGDFGEMLMMCDGVVRVLSVIDGE